MKPRIPALAFATLAAGWIAAAGMTPAHAAPAPSPATAPGTPTAPKAELQPVLALLHQADTALAAKQVSTAEDRMEKAETMLLNDRHNGEGGFREALRDLAAARAAVTNGNRGAAQLSLGQAIGKLGQVNA